MAYTFIDDAIPAVDHEAITVSTSAIGLTAGKLTTANLANAVSGEQSYIEVKRVSKALITVETDLVRFRIDGTNPTSSTGHQLSAGDSLEISGFQNLTNIRFIRSGAADATIRITYYRR